jgi:branched-chain amino acid transport system substrate-binding protein
MTTRKTRRLVALITVAGIALAAPAFAQDKTVKIGVLNDMSSLYADIGGPNSVVAIKMAVEDSGLTKKGWKIDVVSGDHQNKPDVGVNIARQWLDNDKVDAIADTPNSGVALAVNNLVKEKNAVLLNSGAATADLTGKACTPNTISFTYDTYMLANGTGKALTKAGGDTWFFLTADYAFGAALERDTAAVVKANDGKVLGGVKHPINSSDFSSFLLQAQSSKAKVVGLANAGGDTTNSIKQAAEFGIVAGGQKLAALLLFINDVHSLGLKATQGMYLTDSWYWNRDAESRAWSRKFFDKFKRMPSSLQAADYSATLQYLTAVKASGTDDPDKVLAQMKKTKINDIYVKGGWIRDDGSMIHDMYLMQVKSPDKSTEPWDYYNIAQTFKGEEAWTTKAESKCAVWK